MDLDKILSIKQRYGIVGNSDKLNYAIQVAMQVAPTDLSILIIGESGSGKEFFSKIIHDLSLRKHYSFIAINCAAIPPGTIDSELFGHEKGSFTGALEMRRGYFESINRGSIFLDEIAEMPIGTQARLLRVLENKEFIRVGSSQVKKADIRIIAATHVNLIDRIKRREFREDLYYRLNTVPIYVPPLRERTEDIELLFNKFASDFAQRNRMKPIHLDEEAKSLIIKYSFPGNIRQLKNLVERISILDARRLINASILKQYLPKEETGLSVVNNSENTKSTSFEADREILYKILFDMKQDVIELKKIVLALLRNTNSSSDLMNKYSHIFNSQEIKNTPVLIPQSNLDTDSQNVEEL